MRFAGFVVGGGGGNWWSGLLGKGVEWDGDDNVERMWEQVKQAMVESAREVCSSVKVGGENPKSVW